MNCIRRMGRIWLIVLAAVVPAAPASGISASEDQLKALLLYKLISFVHWPDASLDTGSAQRSPQSFQLCVLGGEEVARQLVGRKVGEATLRVRQLSDQVLSEASGCHLLFVDSEAERRIREQLPGLQTGSVLLVTDARRGAERGYMVEIGRQGARLNLRINLAAARAAGLGVSASLIQVAQVVE